MQVLEVLGVFVSCDQMSSLVVQDTLRDAAKHALRIWTEEEEVSAVDVGEDALGTGSSVGTTCVVFRRGKHNRPAKEEVQVKDEWELILANHAVSGAAATGTSNTA